MDPVSRASFGLNETLRIVVPGYYFLAMFYLYVGAVRGKLLGTIGSEAGLFPFLVVGLAFGFIFFTLNYPNKRRAYKEGQPSDYLWKRSRDLAAKLNSPRLELDKNRQEHIQLYMYVLNNFLPQTFHEVVIVRGGLYFCITYVWLISLIWAFLSAVTLILFSVLRCIPLGTSYDLFALSLTISGKNYFFLALYCALQFMIFALLFFPRRADRTLRVLFYDQIEWMKLNEPLITYLLAERLDPRVYEFLAPAQGRKS